jgi:hypothetical protein
MDTFLRDLGGDASLTITPPKAPMLRPVVALAFVLATPWICFAFDTAGE